MQTKSVINNLNSNKVAYDILFPVLGTGKEIFTSLEAEREAMSYILNEDIAQLISIAKMRLSGDTANEVNTYLTLALKKVRQLAFEIKPQVLEQFNLRDALQMLLSQRLKFNVNFRQVYVHNIPQNMDSLVQTAIFRLVQQILNVVVLIDHSRFALSVYRTGHFITVKLSFVLNTLSSTEKDKLKNDLTKAAQAVECCFKGHHYFQFQSNGKVIYSVCLDER